eukprot:TRINITY_DN27402_c0_g1_i1.p1 TRINITY_DN27402_c0_g1~~TRINITY_DN27402_c0_g1_i1.p1  ORF type:complete len:443 (+),score=69.98 TRINITY_DN27402_c0_g1_i1:70-1329(+)
MATSLLDSSTYSWENEDRTMFRSSRMNYPGSRFGAKSRYDLPHRHKAYGNADEAETILFNGTSLQPQVWGATGGPGQNGLGLSMTGRSAASGASPRSAETAISTPRDTSVLSNTARSMLHPLAERNLPELPLIDEGNDVHGIVVLGGKGSGKTCMLFSMIAALTGSYPPGNKEWKEKKASMPAYGNQYEMSERTVRMASGQTRSMRVVLTDTPPCGTSKEEHPLCASVSPNCSQHFNALPSWMRITMRSNNLPHYAVCFVIDGAATPLWEDHQRCRELARLLAVLKRSQYTVALAVTKLHQVREQRIREVAFGTNHGTEVWKDPRSCYEGFVGRYIDKTSAAIQAKAKENGWSLQEGPDDLTTFPLPNVTIFDVPTWATYLDWKAFLQRTGTPELPNLKYANSQLTRLLHALSKRSHAD